MKNGFTLFEVIVSIALMAIVGTMITMVFVTISKYQSRKYETIHIKNQITQIHEIYLSNPLTWEDDFFELHGFDFDLMSYKGNQMIYYSKDFTSVVNYESNYYIKYDFTISSDEISNLVIVEIKRDDKVLEENINLGRFIKVEEHA